jgi:hypothetical protein
MLDDAQSMKIEMMKNAMTLPSDLQRQAWEGWDNRSSRDNQSDGMGAFLAPLERPLQLLKNATDAQINKSLEDALKQSIYPII